MDEIDKAVMEEIKHIQKRLRIMSDEIIDIKYRENDVDASINSFTIEDAYILREIADGFDEEIVTAQKPILKVVPKPNDD